MRLRIDERFATHDVPLDLGAIADLAEQVPLEREDDAGDRVSLPQRAEGTHEMIEELWMRVAVGDAVVDELHDVHARVERIEASANRWEDLLKVPRGEGGKFGVRLHDGNHLTPCERLQSAGEDPPGSARALRESTDDAVFPREEDGGLARFRPVPRADADGLVDRGRHAGWYRRRARAYAGDMHYDLVDRVLECSHDRIVTIKQVSQAEEYLQDHFATFPVLPGVLMLEAMVQAARRLVLAKNRDCAALPLVLGKVRALKYGRFVRPGAVLRVEVSLLKGLEGGAFDFKGEGAVLEPDALPEQEPPTAVSGRFTLRPARIGSWAPACGA